VLLVPNTALRFSPAVSSSEPQKAAGGIMDKLLPHPPAQSARPTPSASGGKPQVWVLRDARAVPVEIETSVSNGQLTELIAGKLSEGTQVITEATDAQP